VKVLLDKGADFSSIGSWKKTPQQLATWLGESARTEDLRERYNSFVRLVKDAIFASLGLTKGSLLPVD
jgi:ABC-type Fe3+-hydroxamate transport system substrate-binding protein